MAKIQSVEQSLKELLELIEHGPAVSPANAFHMLLVNGASFEMAVDADPTPVAFSWTNPLDAGREAHLEGFHIAVIGNAAEDVDGFFAIAAQSVGLLIEVLAPDGTTVLEDFNTTAAPIKRHAELSLLSGVGSTSDTTGGKSRFSVDVEFPEVHGHALLMAPGASFRITVRDDIAALTMFRTSVHGHY